jgi:signal transduction histidine kinase/DNA-binding NarL/FixJ family response regulator
MKNLVAISPQKGFSAALETVLPADLWRVIHHTSPWEKGLLSVNSAVDVIVVECRLTDVMPIQLIKSLKKLQPFTPVLLYTDEERQEWVEEAYLAGASYILPKPIRHALFTLILQRVCPPELTQAHSAGILRKSSSATENIKAVDTPQSAARTLAALRDFSRILTRDLVTEALPKRFLDLLREILSVNRAAIFLRKPSSSFLQEMPGSRLTVACGVGLPAGLLEYFELSLDGGIGRYLHREGRILRSDSPEILDEQDIQKEFEVLGVKFAIPILDRETLVGVALFDERVAGGMFSSEELSMIFHALEELGLAIKNSWLNDELAQSHDLMTEILGQLTSGCVVVGHDLRIMHCNPAARRFLLGADDDAHGVLQFSDLPQTLGSRVFESLKTGVSIAAFRHRPQENPGHAFHVSVIPFSHKIGTLPSAALLLIDDFTQIQHSQHLEIEASNLRMVRSMAEHLSHEIGNALVPMSTHQQLLSEKYEDPEFRGSLGVALMQGIKRISRLSNQLLFLTRDDTPRNEPISALRLIEDAFSDAQTLYGLNGRHLEISNPAGPLTFNGNRASLLHALSETLLNALQSSPVDSSVSIQVDTQKENDATFAKIQIVDKGPGFTPDLADKAVNPFFSTRTVGPGLGLTVAKKIIENHHGRMSLITGEAKGKVAIYLPLKNGNTPTVLSQIKSHPTTLISENN